MIKDGAVTSTMDILYPCMEHFVDHLVRIELFEGRSEVLIELVDERFHDVIGMVGVVNLQKNRSSLSPACSTIDYTAPRSFRHMSDNQLQTFSDCLSIGSLRQIIVSDYQKQLIVTCSLSVIPGDSLLICAEIFSSLVLLHFFEASEL